MKGYSAREGSIFQPRDKEAWEIATRLVESLPESSERRCHELARAVCVTLHKRGYTDWVFCDGRYGLVEHSWLVNEKTANILDVYSVASLPMVQLLNSMVLGVRRIRDASFHEYPKREDIQEKEVEALVALMEEV